MIRVAQGNLLDADVEALVNTVNTVGVMGKGVALMFKEAFAENYRAYVAACELGEVRIGKMFVTERRSLDHPRWIINFPTKQDWRGRSHLDWIAEGLEDLRAVLNVKHIHSVALPPLGTGNGGLAWTDVRPLIVRALGTLKGVDVMVYEPTRRYQNVAKRTGVEKLTPARALIAELVRRYWVLGIGCSLLEIQKLAWFLQRGLEQFGPDNPLRLHFSADKYGPYSDSLRHLLNDLDGSYLHCTRRIADATPFDTIWFDDAKKDWVAAYLGSEGRQYLKALDATTQLIAGFESPLGMELLGTVDWLLANESCEPTLPCIRRCIERWPSGAGRKQRLLEDRLIDLALERLAAAS